MYIHGQGGNADEAAHYRPLFPEHEVIGLDYTAETPWEAVREFPERFDALCGERPTILIANSIGAFFAMSALSGKPVTRAYFISPVVDMERLILDMLSWAGVTEEALREEGEIETAFGQTLSWDYLTYVRAHPLCWTAPTTILYGGGDRLIARNTVAAFAERTGAVLTVMERGEHWFHTEEQMRFLDDRIRTSEAEFSRQVL